jgi:HSP20 family protein
MLRERLDERDRMDDLEEIFEILISSSGTQHPTLPAKGDLSWRPATDAYETAGTFVVQMDLAGMDRRDIEVQIEEEELVVRGIRRDIAPPGKKHYFKMEISVGPFLRRIPLPVGIDPRNATARYRNGFLYITFGRGRGRRSAGRQIKIDE